MQAPILSPFPSSVAHSLWGSLGAQGLNVARKGHKGEDTVTTSGRPRFPVLQSHQPQEAEDGSWLRAGHSTDPRPSVTGDKSLWQHIWQQTNGQKNSRTLKSQSLTGTHQDKKA